MSTIALKAGVIAALTSGAQAWSYFGHMAVARIAERILEKEAPSVITAVEGALLPFHQSFPKLTPREDSHLFVECATFADEIKREGGGYQSGWHFTDKPFLDQGGSISDFDYVVPKDNVTDAITSISNWINEVGDYKNNQYYNAIHGSWPTGRTEEDSYSIAVRLLIHYVGDSHQPLHSETLVDKQHPDGDKGGNDINLPNHYSANNLHSVWDKVVYEFHVNPKTPFTSDVFKSFDTDIDGLL